MKDQMSIYTGAKLVAAMPMLLGEYLNYLGQRAGTTEDPQAPGYLIEDSLILDANHEDHLGRLAWLPKAGFEQTFMLAGLLDFSAALHAIQANCKLSRTGWSGKGMFIYQMQRERVSVNQRPLTEIYPHNTLLDYAPHINIRAVSGCISPWQPSSEDLFATDWYIVN